MVLQNSDAYIIIPPDLKQTFENKFNLNIGKNEIIKMKNSNAITDRDLAIAKFLFQFKFATNQQLHRFLSEIGTPTSLKSRLDKLVKYRILNKFMLSPFEQDAIQPDALEIYCLDLGGRYLLAHYSNEDTSDWYSTVNMKASEIISRNLFITEFYLRLKETCPGKILSFKVDPEFRVSKKNIFPSFEMSMKINEQTRYYIGEVVRDYDFPVHFREKAFKLDSLLATNAWKKYYYDTNTAPILFIFTDSDRTATEAGKLLTEITEIQDFRFSTDARIQNVLYELGAFLRYFPEEDIVRPIKASTFAP